ncbi:MAG TPA: hypothetical protein VF070_09695 [Streptosporangiaceae bacterium]
MLVVLTAVTLAGWLVVFVMLVAASRTARMGPADGGEPARGVESPAVVSLLAGNLDALGYPATLLDLAARGWLRLEPQPDGSAMCVLPPERPRQQLTSYEQQVYDQVLSRAGNRSDVPAAALSDGFAAPVAAGPGATGPPGTDMKSATDTFMAAFRKEVIADSRRRGLSRQRLSEAAGCLLWLAAAAPAVTGGFALNAAHVRAYWIPVVGFFALCAVAGIAVRGEKLTPAGRAALRRWQAECAPSGTAAPRTANDRLTAYAAALGRAPAMVRLFAGPRGQRRGRPEGRTVWSSYTGSWREITIGEPRGWRQAGGPMIGILAWIMLALLPATLAVAVLTSGTLRGVAFLAMACDAVIVIRMLTKGATLPRSAEFNGRVIEAWIDEESGENSTSYIPRIAIDDGLRDRAWVFIVSREQYARFTPGTDVRALVNPRRNQLLEIDLIPD